MARPVRITLSAAGVSAPVVLNNIEGTPFNVGIGCDISAGGSMTYTVEHTFDDVFANNFNPSTATWFPHANLASKTVDADGNYAFPIMACRLNVGTYGSGSITFTVIQSG